jgi:hypothetical protein
MLAQHLLRWPNHFLLRYTGRMKWGKSLMKFIFTFVAILISLTSFGFHKIYAAALTVNSCNCECVNPVGQHCDVDIPDGTSNPQGFCGGLGPTSGGKSHSICHYKKEEGGIALTCLVKKDSCTVGTPSQ